MFSVFKCFVVCVCFFYTWHAYADASIDRVLADQVVHEPTQYAYQETRYMQLLDMPWLASGFMYMSPLLFVMEQQHPHRLVIVSNRTTMWLYDGKNNRRRSQHISLASSGIMALAGLMMSLRTGKTDHLKERYEISLKEKELHWEMQFLPTGNDIRQYYAKILFKGQMNGLANMLEVEYANGNRTSWRMKQDTRGENISSRMKKLRKEAQGG